MPKLTGDTLTFSENAQTTDMSRVFVVKKTAKLNRGSGGDMIWQSENANSQTKKSQLILGLAIRGQICAYPD